jgi:hypothetical protein
MAMDSLLFPRFPQPIYPSPSERFKRCRNKKDNIAEYLQTVLLVLPYYRENKTQWVLSPEDVQVRPMYWQQYTTGLDRELSDAIEDSTISRDRLSTFSENLRYSDPEELLEKMSEAIDVATMRALADNMWNVCQSRTLARLFNPLLKRVIKVRDNSRKSISLINEIEYADEAQEEESD